MRKKLYIGLIVLLAVFTYWFLLAAVPYIASTSSHCQEVIIHDSTILGGHNWVNFTSNRLSWVIYSVPGLVYALFIVIILKRKEAGK